MNDVLLDVRALGLRVGARTLVSSLTLQARAGELWCVLGPNGSGKTTLLHTLAGLRAPAAGAVSCLELDVAHAPPEALARRRGLLTQTVHDSFSARALDVVLLGRHPHHDRWSFGDSDDDRRIALEALAAVDATELAARDVTTLSGGERQRVAVAALLAQQVPLMLLDEPTAHLDLKHQIGLLEHLRAWVHQDAHAAVIALHDLNLAARFATHALLLAPDGHPRAGPVDDVMTDDALAAAFDHPLKRQRIDSRWAYLPG
jgi:iron complex transport system ATP-binding protein